MDSEPPNDPGAWLAFLAGRGARLAAEGVADFGALGEELAAARDATIRADLSPNALIAASGDDAAQFLHAQFTNDVLALSPGMAQWNGWCSAKGRLLATFLLLRRADGFLMMLPQEIAPAVAKRLGMFVLRSKVKLQDAGARHVRMGLAGTGAAAIAARHFGQAPAPMASVERDGATCVALDETRFVILAAPESAPALWDALAQEARPAATAAWDWTSIQAGIPTIVAATQEAFVPQMANLDLVGALSFRKGCYPGQEIVARTQYRGILKRRMALAHADAEVAPGDAVYSAAFGEQAAGEVAN
ncbi:MAG TPA: folate-binding protein, partial [Myxococcota bacterium]|nr:folate-binding protein [Myxococcota bacterium]